MQSDNALKIIDELKVLKKVSDKKYRKILARYPKSDGLFSKDEIIKAYRNDCKSRKLEPDPDIMAKIQMKPTRTISGVAPVTVLTKPYPCPGKCIFCPTDIRMPKSYLHDEPGAMRAEMNAFDPFRQVQMRIKAFENIGHNTDKIELLILGGTWSSYPLEYRIWFVKRCFDAMNSFSDSTKQTETATWEELEEAQRLNVYAKHRCVGLSIETRPDHITQQEVKNIRRLGATKVQIGIQSMDDRIHMLNKRGHTVEETRKAFDLLRLAGLKIHGHWMANLLGATVESDKEDFKKLFEDEGIKPDELKIYPCILVKNAELYNYYERGEFKPYTHEELLNLIVDVTKFIPKYCRINRLFRDFPTPNIVDGVKNINFRQVVDEELKKQGIVCNCIRCREIKKLSFDNVGAVLDKINYTTRVSKEYFLSYNTPDGKLLGFLRLSIPDKKLSNIHFIEELKSAAIIREIHVYGPAQKINSDKSEKAQHQGYGTLLINEAKIIAARNGYDKLAVISAIGTREYYEKRGFEMKGMYQVMDI